MFIRSNHQREKLAYQYTMALEQGDMERVSHILTVAESDAQLEQMILEINHVLESEFALNQSVQSQEAIMPVFTKEKRKRHHKHPLWTAAIAVLVSVLFSGFALFFATQPRETTSATNIESIPAEITGTENLAYQFLEAWNNNQPEVLDAILSEGFQYFEANRLGLGKLALQRRIGEFNASFDEVHFQMTDMTHSQSGSFIHSEVDLKALHVDVAGTELQYYANGFIEFTFSNGKIQMVDMGFNLQEFADDYGYMVLNEQRDYLLHEVVEGDTVYGIIAEYGIPSDVIPEILEYNSMNTIDDIQVEDVLKISRSSIPLSISPPSDFDATLQTQHIEIDDVRIHGLYVDIDAGQADVRIGSLPSPNFMADIENMGSYDYTENGSRFRVIQIENHPYEVFKDDGERPVWYFKLNESIRTDLHVQVGNSDMMLDLQHVELEGLQLTMGEGTTSLNLPDTGANNFITVIALSNKGTLKLDYPDHLGLRIMANDGIWQSRNYTSSDSVINIQLQGSLSILDMLRE